MPEMPAAREDHRQAALVGRGDDFRVAHRAAGLHDRGGAGVGDARRARRGTGRTRRRPRPIPASAPAAAFITATFTASTRLICPAPTASVRSAPVKIMVFDFTCAQTRHANRSAIHSSAVGCRFVDRPSGVRRLRSQARARAPRHPIALLLQHPAEERPHRRIAARSATASACASKSAVTTRRFVFAARIALRLVVEPTARSPPR